MKVCLFLIQNDYLSHSIQIYIIPISSKIWAYILEASPKSELLLVKYRHNLLSVVNIDKN